MSFPNLVPLNPNYELTKSFLFLRTASTAVSNSKAQIEGTKAYVQWNSVNGYYEQHCYYQEELDKEEEELRKWEKRFIDAATQVVDWAAKTKTGKWLPREIVGIIREYIEWDEGTVLKRIW